MAEKKKQYRYIRGQYVEIKEEPKKKTKPKAKDK